MQKSKRTQEKQVQRSANNSDQYVDLIENDMDVYDDDNFMPIRSKKGGKTKLCNCPKHGMMTRQADRGYRMKFYTN